MSLWLCTVCETENTYRETNFNNRNGFVLQRCKVCNNCNPTSPDTFESHLEINRKIDCLLPRHHIEIEISNLTLLQINHGMLIKKPLHSLLDYVRNRLYYRTFYINKRWRRNICYRKFLKIMLKYINCHDTKIEDSLIMQYLIADY